MNLKVIQEKGIYLTSVLFALFVFFIPLSPSLKSIFFALGVASVLFNPYYNQYLVHAFSTYWGKIAVLFVGLIAIACLWSPAPFSLQMSVLSKYSKLLYLPILAVGFLLPKTRAWCINAYILSMIVTCVTAILKSKGLLHIGDPKDAGDLFYNHIITGFMMAVGCYLAALQAIKCRGKWRVLYIVAISIMSFQVLFLNNGRTGYVIYVLLMGLLIIQRLPLKKACLGLVALGAGMLLVYVLSPTMQNGVHNLILDTKSLDNTNSYSSLGFRFRFHDYAHTLFMKHPIIGVGTGGFQYNYTQDQPIPTWGPILNDPHSQYWMTLSEQGIIGVLFLFLFLGSLFIASLQLKENKSLILGVLAAFLFGAYSDSILCYSTIGYLLIIFSALGFSEYIERYALQKKSIDSTSDFASDPISA